MFTLPFGFIAMLAVIYLSVESDKWMMYMNAHAIIIVVFGTVALLLFTTPMSVLSSLWKAFINLFGPDQVLGDYKEEFGQLARTRRLGGASRNELINYAAELWERGVEPDLFIVLSAQKRQEIEEKENDAIQALRSLAKYPPALGMTGTVIGLVALFAGLSGDDVAGLGPALALAMTATFFGLIVANVLVQPLADRLQVKYIQKKRLYKNIFQVLTLINQNEAAAIVEEEVNSRAA